MNFTFDSPRNIVDKNFPFPVPPPVVYKTISVKDLIIPRGLFDEKTSGSPAAPLDSLLPLLVTREDKTEKFGIVDGCKRFKRFIENKQNTSVCGVFEEDIDKKNRGFLRIFLNRNRPKSIRESVCFFKWLNVNCQESGGEKIMESLGFDATVRLELKPLLTSSDLVLDAVNDGRLAARCVADFCLFNSQDQAAFLEAFRGIDLSQQTQREFFEWLPEIAYSKKTTISLLLESENIRRIMQDKILNNPQKIEAIRTLLHSWKFPLYDETLRNWKKLASEMSKAVLENEPSSKVVFSPAPAFEMNKLEIKITINHAPAAKEIFQKLSEVPQKTWSRLIYPLS